ncbi:MAG: C39 family peptidase [Ktedonobacteraceae bacterium]
MIPLSSTGEIADFRDVDQFQPGHSEFACGFFAVAIVKAMSQVGQSPKQSAAEMTAEAEAWYARYNGNNSTANEIGMSLPQLYELLAQVGLHYQSIASDVETIRAWVAAGYPVIIAGAEIGMVDIGLGGIVPYPWHPAGNHVIVVTGNARGGHFLVRDPANCTSLSDPHSLRPGPRTYDASKLQLVSATAVMPPWRARPTEGFDPRNIPAGWQDDGSTLTAPNGHKVARGFRAYLLARHWDSEDWPLNEEEAAEPLEISNPALGAGTRQVFRQTVLEWTQERGVFEARVGEILLAMQQAVKVQNIPNLQHMLTTVVNATQPFSSANQEAQAFLKEINP